VEADGRSKDQQNVFRVPKIRRIRNFAGVKEAWRASFFRVATVFLVIGRRQQEESGLGAALAILSKNKNQSHLISLPKVSWACAAPLRPRYGPAGPAARTRLYPKINEPAGYCDGEKVKIDHDTTVRSALTSSIEWKWCNSSSSLPSSVEMKNWQYSKD